MTSSTLERREISHPTNLPAPKTWADLKSLMETILPKFFFETMRHIRTTDKSDNYDRVVKELRLALTDRCRVQGEPTEAISDELQSQAAEMLELLGILQPEPEAQSTAGQGIAPIKQSLLHRIGNTLGML